VFSFDDLRTYAETDLQDYTKFSFFKDAKVYNDNLTILIIFKTLFCHNILNIYIYKIYYS